MGTGLWGNCEQPVANLVSWGFPGFPDPAAVHELHRIAQRALAQHVVANRRALAAMRSTIDRAVIVRLLADPYAICDFGDDRAADRTMGADVLAGYYRRTRRRSRTALGLAHAAQWQPAHPRQPPAPAPPALHAPP